MSNMSNLVIEIEEMLISGVPKEEISETLGIPLRWVEDVSRDVFDYMYG